MGRIIQIKRGPKSAMPTLSQGELAMTTDTGSESLFIGTGTENIELARKSDLDAIPIPDVSGQIGTHNSDSSAHSDIRESITTHTGNTSVHVTTEEKATWNAKANALFKPAGKSYLTFSSPNDFTLKINDTMKHWDGILEYFSADKTWTTWDGTATLSAVDNDGEYVLYLRGTGNTVITGTSSNYKWVITGTDISCIGNIENLLDYATVKSGVHPTMADRCYQHMFRDCTSLTQAPALPATTLADRCYSNMFRDCTSLTQAPDLPAITLATNCYYYMFYGCTALTQAPALPATMLADYCYSNMFQDCISLTQAPALPATTSADRCYTGMFQGCTALTKAPALPATTLATNCYYNMFQGCTALTQAPALPATTLVTNCYYNMFQGCTSLKLSSSKTDEYTQEYRIPSSGTGITADNALTDMFVSTGGTFTGTPGINTTYYFSSDNMIVRDTEVATLNGYVRSISAPASHASDETIHVTADQKTAWDAKATTTYVDQKISEIPTPDVSGQIGTHNSDSSAHSDIRESITTHTGDTSIHVTAEEKATWNTKADAPFKPAGKSYLTFSSPNSFTLAVGDATKHWDGTLEYFASDKTWTTWDGTTTLSSIDNDGEYVLYLRGTGNTVITGYNQNYRWVLTGSDIACIGNIENLLDCATVKAGNHPTMASYCYYSMFRDCTGLTQVPALPATTLEEHCYHSIFRGCTSLAQAPALPATTLAVSCYDGMLSGCTSLTQAPVLPATTLASNCYDGMLSGCTGLVQAPALPATTLASSCYYNMFYGCSSLTQAPALPATTLADSCYQHMFYGCTSLTQAPALPATTLANSCYYRMFSGCTGLTQAPALPATTLASNCYDSMFRGCTSLTQVPVLPATTLASNCYDSMFRSCTSLKFSTAQTGEYIQEYRVPSSGTGTTATDALRNMFVSTGGTFTGTPEVNTTYYLSTDNMIVHETEIATLNGYVGSIAVPTSRKVNGKVLSSDVTLSASDVGAAPASHTSDSTVHVTAEEKTAWNAKADAQFKPAGKSYLMFSSPNSFTLAVNDATKHWDGTLEYFASNKTWTTWDGTTTLSAVDNDGEYVLYLRGIGNTVIAGNGVSYNWALTGTNIACVGNIETLLDYATVEAGNHPIMGSHCYRVLFKNCTALTKAPDLPATTLAIYCYGSMFSGCKSLTKAPALPATTLATSCYYGMFSGCKALTQAPALPATTLSDHCYVNMFTDCTSLVQAPALPATTLKTNCYYSMFYGCTSLTQAPALPATTLASSCYQSMFNGCTKIKLSTIQNLEYAIAYRIPMSGDGTIATNATANMFSSTGGTFTGTPDINTTYYLSSDNMVVRETEIATLNGYVDSMIDAAHSYGTEDLEAGTSSLETGKLYFVYE